MRINSNYKNSSDRRKGSYVGQSILKKLPVEDRKVLDGEHKGDGSKRVVRFIVSVVQKVG